MAYLRTSGGSWEVRESRDEILRLAREAQPFIVLHQQADGVEECTLLLSTASIGWIEVYDERPPSAGLQTEL